MSFPTLVFVSCLTLVLNTMAFMTITPVLPELLVQWNLTETEAGLLGGAFFIGYVAAVPILVPLTDRILPKKIYVISGVIGTISCFGFAFLADGLWTGIFFRILTGIGVAGTYMPALKAMADDLEEPYRTKAASYYTSVYAVGTAASILAGGVFADWLDWRWSFIAAGIGIFTGFVIGSIALPNGKISENPVSQFAAFRRAFQNRAAMANISAYFGHLWEVFSNRVWIVAFLVMAESHRGSKYTITAAGVATLVALCGVPVSMWCGEALHRYGRNKVLNIIMLSSLVVGILVALTTAAPLWIVASLAILYGMVSYADTGPLNATTVSLAEPEVRGATMAIHACTGFAGGILGALAIGITLQNAGGINAPEAWRYAFLVMASGSAFGLLMRWRANRAS
ncbi:MAG: MFS transporter [Rhodospirillaceae bacterium]